MTPDHISLHTLNQQIKEQLNIAFAGTIWVIAEISEIRTTRAGHCYVELIEKSSDSDEVIAKARGTIWSFTFRMLKPYFETSTGQTLQAGLKILFKASVEFQEVYGYSLNIKDIDPSFTLGDIERKRLETIKKLEEDGVIDMNKETYLNPVPQRIAIISSPTAAGYQDFVHQLETSPEGYKIYHHLFPAIVQGEEAENSIIAALERIYDNEHHFDAVALIRGGGSSADLMCFNNYLLALNIAQFPLPVLTGIGHERDVSVADMVAHSHLKTPTAVAEFIIQQITDFHQHLEGLQTAFTDITSRKIIDNKHFLEIISRKASPLVISKITKHKSHLMNLGSACQMAVSSFVELQHRHLLHHQDASKYMALKALKSQKQNFKFFSSKLNIETRGYFKSKNQTLHLLGKTTELSDPEHILDKGYSITYQNGKAIKSALELTIGSKIVSQLRQGKIISKVERLKEG